MRVRIKICGINTLAALDAAVGAGADWVGFVFFPRSPRFVTPAEAVALANVLPDEAPGRVGLFVDPSDEIVAAALDVVRLDVLQVYASPQRAEAVRAKFGIPVWRSVGIGMAADLPARADGVDGLVVEARSPAAATRPGGNATSFEWSLTKAWRAPLPWVLAGGLTATNVVEAIRVTGAPAVDVSSGVENKPGMKDPSLIRAFVAAVRTARDARREVSAEAGETPQAELQRLG